MPTQYPCTENDIPFFSFHYLCFGLFIVKPRGQLNFWPTKMFDLIHISFSLYKIFLHHRPSSSFRAQKVRITHTKIEINCIIWKEMKKTTELFNFENHLIIQFLFLVYSRVFISHLELPSESDIVD